MAASAIARRLHFPPHPGCQRPSYGDDNTPLKTPNSPRRQPFEPCLKDAAGTGGEGGCSAMRTGAAALPLQRWWLWAIGQSLCWLSSAGGANGCCASRALSCAALAPFSLEGEGQRLFDAALGECDPSDVIIPVM